MGYTHHDKVSGVTGLAVGAKGSEIVVADSVGDLYIQGVKITASAAELNAAAGTGVDSTELGYLDGATAGTQVASKCVVADANVNIGVTKVTELHIGTSGSETQVTASGTELNLLAGVTATTAEINRLDDSAETETIDSGVAISAAKTHTAIDNTTSGAGAITLAAPGAAMIGKIKIIEMTVDNGDVTLALTNVTGGSAATTCTWSAVDQALVLVGGTNKWHVVAESGVALT